MEIFMTTPLGRLLHYVKLIVLKILRRLWWLFHNIFLNKYVRAFILFLGKIWLSILLLLMQFFFLQVEQARDILADVNTSLLTSTTTHLSAFLSSLSTWYYLRILFLLTSFTSVKTDQKDLDLYRQNSDGRQWLRIKPVDLETIQLFSRWLPPILGTLPMLGLIVAFSTLGLGSQVFTQFILLFIYTLIFYRDRKYVSDERLHQIKQNWKERNALTEEDKKRIDLAHDYELSFPIQFNDLLPLHRRFVWLGLGLFALFLLWAIIFKLNLFFSTFIGPIAVVFLALSMWTLAGNVIIYSDFQFKAPVSLAVIAMMTLGMGSNNNHQVRTLEEPFYFSKKDDKQKEITAYFERWYRNPARRQGLGANADTVYIIAAEGGGIRAAYWTASVLSELEEECPGKTKQIFAISGVSGGSVGAAFYTAFYKDLLTQKMPRTKKVMHTFHMSVFKNDFLSPLLTACLGGDLLQKFLPFVAINGLDRAQYLEDTWSHYYKKNMPNGCDLSTNTLDESFMSLWKDTTLRYQIPTLFLNTTRVETGQRAVLTPLAFHENDYFHEVIDLQEHIRRNIPLKVAASMSARFPIVTPPATVVQFNKPTQDVANYVDGGYVDNTGLETAGAILNTLTKYTERWPIKPCYRLIFIRNSSSLDPTNQPKPVKALYEYSAPLSAFVNAWGNSTGPKLTLAKEFLREKALAGKGVDSTLFLISLDRNVGTIPLGWELSKEAEKRIDAQIETLSTNHPVLFRREPRR